jgi:hypothetical protein
MKDGGYADLRLGRSDHRRQPAYRTLDVIMRKMQPGGIIEGIKLCPRQTAANATAQGARRGLLEASRTADLM